MREQEKMKNKLITEEKEKQRLSIQKHREKRNTKTKTKIIIKRTTTRIITNWNRTYYTIKREAVIQDQWHDLVEDFLNLITKWW